MDKPMPRWIAPWLYGVATLHSLFGVVVFWPQWQELARDGLWNTAGVDPTRAGAVLFLQVGLLVFALAASIAAHGTNWPPRSVGIWLLALTVPSVVVMPESGYWLILPPALVLARKRAAKA